MKVELVFFDENDAGECVYEEMTLEELRFLLTSVKEGNPIHFYDEAYFFEEQSEGFRVYESFGKDESQEHHLMYSLSFHLPEVVKKERLEAQRIMAEN